MKKRTSSTPHPTHQSRVPHHHPPSASHSHGQGDAADPAGTSAGDVATLTTRAAALDLHTIRIGYFQPEAHEVYVAGSFNDWNPRETPLTRDSFGDWSVELSLPPGEHRYRLVVDGQWCDDPCAQCMEANPFDGYDAVVLV